MTNEPGLVATTSRRRPSLGGGLILAVATVVVVLLAAEIVDRLRDPSASLWRYPNYIDVWQKAWAVDPEERGVLRYDSELGYEPVPGASGTVNGRPISYSTDGFRTQNLGAPPAAGPSILVLGDSYTEGWSVSGDESWPAHLERQTGRRTLNAGVRGYGIDQMVLRAERLVPRFKPRTMVLAFIGSDIERTALSFRDFKHKPYFVPAGDGLELRNVPVPTTPLSGPLVAMRSVLGYSHLLDTLMRRLDAYDFWFGNNVGTGIDGVLVSCRLMERFAALARKYNVKALVVALRQSDRWNHPLQRAVVEQKVAAVLACARQAGLATLDTSAAFAAAAATTDPAYFVADHYTDRGNALAASLIAAALAAKN
ncbi:MAG: GDSL-type esterase/lipase family protein [Reyranella sp.]|nr:GDSL-type esterase/lipase family protein [Reyranella sp.]